MNPGSPGTVQPCGRQRGAALLLSLVLLGLVTLAGLAAVGHARLQLKMALNQNHWLSAFVASEAALRRAEGSLLQPGAAPAGSIDCSNPAPIATPDCRPQPFDGPEPMVDRVRVALPGGYSGEYVIQYLGRTANEAELYRISARALGTGQDTGSPVVVLQSAGWLTMAEPRFRRASWIELEPD